MSEFWRAGDLESHIDQHRLPEAREREIMVYVGDQTADFEKFALVPPHGTLILRRAYFIQPTANAADGTDYWTIKIIQHDPQGREITLVTFDGSTRSLDADTAVRIPVYGNVDKDLRTELPIFVKGVKSGAATALDDLTVQLVIAHR